MKKIFIALSLCVSSLFANAQFPNLSRVVEEYSQQHNFNGTVLIQKDNKILYHASFGLANREFKVPVTNDTRYKICSITKSLTAVLILQLYERGKLI